MNVPIFSHDLIVRRRPIHDWAVAWVFHDCDVAWVLWALYSLTLVGKSAIKKVPTILSILRGLVNGKRPGASTPVFQETLVFQKATLCANGRVAFAFIESVRDPALD